MSIMLKIEIHVPKENFKEFGKTLFSQLKDAGCDMNRIQLAGFSDFQTFHVLLVPELLTDEFSDLLGDIAAQFDAKIHDKIEEV